MTVPNETASLEHATTSEERWVAAPEFEGHYLVSSEGRVQSLKRRQSDGSALFVNWKVGAYGYAAVDLWRDGKAKRCRVHVLVATAFLGPRPEGQEVRHLDGDRMNPSLANLVYGTRSENSHDKLDHGTDHNAVKTHCPQGHPYDDENTYVLPSRPNARYCRACQRVKSLRRYHRSQQA